MAKSITCQCGEVINGGTDDELVSAAEAHMQAKHPNLVGKLSRDQILAMASSSKDD